MSVARGNGQNGGHFYSNITQPVMVNCQFIVDSTNASGIRSLKSNGYVTNVFMHTSATPATGNPNPASGDILVQLNNNYNHFIILNHSFIVPLSGSNVTSTTAGLSYVITVLGTTTLAQWQAAGVPAGVVPAVGVSFVAIATSAIGGTGAVQVPATAGSGITGLEVIGTPELSDTSSIAQYGGMYVLLRAFASGTKTAPANSTTVCLGLLLDASSVTIDGL